GYFTRLRQNYGDAVSLRLGPYRYYAFFHPDQVREVLTTKAKHFRRFRHVRKVMSQLDGDGLVLSEGDFWARQRRLVQPAFHAGRMPRYADGMVELTRQMLDGWGDAAEFDAERAMTDLTLRIVARTFFGADVGGEERRLAEAVAVMSDVFVR